MIWDYLKILKCTKRLCEILQYFEEIPKDLIPTNSLLREFLGNGDFKY